MATNQGALALIESPFTFEDHAVRIIMRDGEPWFVAADACRVLHLDATAIRKLDDDEKGLHSMQTLGGDQSVAVISESGLYTLILRCRDAVKPGTVPYRFRRWVTREVLPSIRKTGSYGTPRIDPAALLLSGQATPVPLLPPEVEQALRRRAWDLTHEAHDLIEEHLRRRVAYWAYAGYPEKTIHSDKAIAALNSGDLGDALTHSHIEKARNLASYFLAMGQLLHDSQQQAKAILDMHGLSSSR